MALNINRLLGELTYRFGSRVRGGVAGKLDVLARTYLAGRRSFNYDPSLNGEYHLIERLAEIQPSLVIDVGANHGDWTAHVVHFIPSATVHAFEINPSLVDQLQARFNSSRRVVVNNCGLSDTAGTIQAKIFENDTLSSIVEGFDLHPEVGSSTQTVFVNTLDDYVAGLGEDQVDFLKIDVEGGEHMVLNGAKKLLAARKIRLIQFEYGYANAVTHMLMRDYYEFFKDNGYRVGKLCRFGVDLSACEVMSWNNFEAGPNFIAIRPEDELLHSLSC
jgi:FkbM family methyltransferase